MPETGLEVSIQKLYRHQYKNNAVYRNWCHHPFTKRTKKGPPHLPIVAFKESAVCSFPLRNSKHYFESSGTTSEGNPIVSKHHLASLDPYRTSVIEGWKWFLQESRFSSPMNFVGLMPSFSEKPHSSLSCMVEILMKEFGAKTGLWAMRRNQWNWPRLHRHLKVLQTNHEPVVLFGTAFGWVHFLDWSARHRHNYRLPRESIVLETGGYKGKSREIERSELHRLLSKMLHLSPSQIRSEYSMCELSSQAYSFPNKSGTKTVFRFPPWCTHRVVHPLTSTEVKLGQKGILEIIDLANIGSCAFIRTEDQAIRHPNGFELLGRLPGAGLKGCSLAFEASQR